MLKKTSLCVLIFIMLLQPLALIIEQDKELAYLFGTNSVHAEITESFAPIHDTFEDNTLPSSWIISPPSNDSGTYASVQNGKLRVTNSGNGNQIVLSRYVNTDVLHGKVKFSYEVDVLEDSGYNVAMPAIYSNAEQFISVSQLLMVSGAFIVSNSGSDFRVPLELRSNHTYRISYDMDFDNQTFKLAVYDVTTDEAFESGQFGFKSSAVDRIERIDFWVGSNEGSSGLYDIDNFKLESYIPEPKPMLMPIYDTFDLGGALPQGWSISQPSNDPDTFAIVQDGKLRVENSGNGNSIILTRSVNSEPIVGKVRVAYTLDIEQNSRYNLAMPALYGNVASSQAASQLLIVGDGMRFSTGDGDKTSSVVPLNDHSYSIEYIVDYDTRTFDLNIIDLTDGTIYLSSAHTFRFDLDRLEAIGFYIGSELGKPGAFTIDDLIVETYEDELTITIDHFSDVFSRITEAKVFVAGSPIAYIDGERILIHDQNQIPQLMNQQLSVPANYFPETEWNDDLIPIQNLQQLGYEVFTGVNGFVTVSDVPIFQNNGADASIVERALDLFGIYVSTEGNDQASGRFDDPLRTIDEARKRILTLKADRGLPIGGVQVYLRSGEYRLTNSIRLDREDSGHELAPITYASYPGEWSHLTGSMTIDNELAEEITDYNIMQRIQPEVLDKLVVYDLELAGIGLQKWGALTPNNSFVAETPSYPELIIDGRRQTLARWPNSDSFTNTGIVLNKDANTTTFSFTNERIQLWEQASDIWLQGFWTWDWYADSLRVLNLDIDQGTITTNNPTFGISGGKRFYAYNLLEELDDPGEWYLDRETGKLYVYPSYSLENSRISWSTLSAPMIMVNQAEYLTFERLILEESRGSGIYLNEPHYVQFNGGIIRNIGQQAVVINGGNNSGVVSSDIYDINKGGVKLGGGDAATLTAGQNYVENSHLYRASEAIRTNIQPIKIDGVGNRVINNLIHDTPHEAIGFEGNEHLIENNEFFNLLQETGDAGAIYTGASWSYYNNLITNNLFHDISGPGGDDTYSVYLDDYTSGTRVIGNLFYNVATPVMINGGRDNTIKDNVIFNSKGTIYASDRSNDMANLPSLVPYQRLMKVPYTTGVWAERYPLLPNILNDNPTYPKYNEIANNLMYNSGAAHIDAGYDAYGTIANNMSYASAPSYSELVDLNGLNGLRIDEMGLRQQYRSELELLGEFRQTYPLHNAINIEANQVKLAWVRAAGADYYRIIVADNPELVAPIIDDLVKGLSYSTTDLAYGEQTYYWKVEAIIGSELHKASRWASGDVFQFTTSLTETVNRSRLASLVNLAIALHDNAVEGSGEGNYELGSKSLLYNVITDAESRLAQLEVTQLQLDRMYNQLNLAITEFGRRMNTRIVQLDEKLKELNNWLTTDRLMLELSADEKQLSFTGTPDDSIVAGYKYTFGAKDILKFGATFNLNSGWQGLGFKAGSADTVGWSNTSYLITVASGRLELIRFGEGGETLLDVPNTVIPSGERVEVELGAVNTIDGVRILFIVDGETVFDIIDDSSHAIWREGLFVLYDAGAQGISIHAAQPQLPDPIEEEAPVSIPGTPYLTHNNTYDSGIGDGTYMVTMNMWWGESGTAYKLIENGVVIYDTALANRTPNAQTVSVDVTGKQNGTYTYTCELSNRKGSSYCSPMTVVVNQANPGVPYLSHNNWSQSASYTLTMNMWWGMNGNSLRIYENGELIEQLVLTAQTPYAQTAILEVSNREPGTYVYVAELVNNAGVTRSQEISVTVR